MVVVAYLLAWTALDLVAMEFQAAEGVSVWYPPAALDFTLLLIFGLRFAPALVLSTVVHATLISPVGLTVGEVVLFGVITTGGYVCAAAVLLRVVRIDPRLPLQRDVSWFVLVACGVGPLAVAVAQVTLLTSAGVVERDQLIISIEGYWAGTATGIAMLAPVLLLLARRWPALWRGRPSLPSDLMGVMPRRGEAVLQFLMLSATVWLAYARGAGGSLDYTYLVFVPLIWIAVRGGFSVVPWAVLAINVGAVALNGGRVPGKGGIALQFGLVSLTLVGLLLGALITQRRRDAERHEHDALHDALTGLPNRLLFSDRLAHATTRADRDPAHAFAVLYLDLDRFKAINDSLGHSAGDQLLTAVAERLEGLTRPGDSVARFGGDEFAVLLEDVATPLELTHAAERILGALAQPYLIDEASLVVTASIGSALATARPTSADDLLRDADIALHRAKRGHSRHVVFDRTMKEHARNELQLEGELRQAIEDDELDVVFQPMFSLPDRGLVGFEALARWQTRSGQSVSPADFIPLAEDTDLICALGRRVLERACKQAAAWRSAGGGPDLRVAVNVSPDELRRPGYAARVLETLAECELPPATLELEIIESQWLERASSATDELAELSRRGVRLVIDDFGTGYSSFGYLRHLSVTGLKVDGTFVASLPDGQDAAAIVKAILAMAAELGLDVTAEGVETDSQLDFLEGLHCPHVQGYLLGRPAPAAALDIA